MQFLKLGSKPDSLRKIINSRHFTKKKIFLELARNVWILVPICLKFSAETLALVEKEDLKGLTFALLVGAVFVLAASEQGRKGDFSSKWCFLNNLEKI